MTDNNSASDEGITVTDLTKQYNHQYALDHITAHFKPGTIHGLLGRNGAGKTTLMSIICNHSFKSSGSVSIDGEDPAENAHALAKTCFIHENQRWHDAYTASMILQSAQRFYPAWDAALSTRLVERLALPLKVRAGKLSRGQRSALAITIALSSHAQYTFLDEAYLGMDATARAVLYEELAVAQSDSPRTFLMSSHLIDECAGLLDTVTILHHGKVESVEQVDDVTANSWVYTGSKERLERVVTQSPILSLSSMGFLCSAVFRGTLTDEQQKFLRQGNTAELRHATLQELVSAIGAIEPQNNTQGETR